MPRMATLHPRLQVRILRAGIEAGAGLLGRAKCLLRHRAVDVGEVAVAEDACIGMGTNLLFMSRLIRLAVAGDVVVVARETEPFRVTADEGCHGKVLITSMQNLSARYITTCGGSTFILGVTPISCSSCW